MPRVIVIGGGFAGIACVRSLSHRRLRDVEIVLFSAENHFVYNPMLAETVGATLNPLDIVMPLREMAPRAFCRTERVRRIDLAAREVEFECYGGRVDRLGYDDLVIACGNVANLHAVPGMADHAFPLKTIGDALALRAHVMDQLEWAEVCEDPTQARWHLSFVVVGGGYSGVEVAGEINDLVKGSLRFFRRIRRDDVQVSLVHSRDQILPEMSGRLRDFARRAMERAGIKFLLRSRVDVATPEGIGLADGTFLRAGTVVSTVGTRPSPVVEQLVAEKEGGRLLVLPDLRLRGVDHVWAVGDCAHVLNEFDGSVCPTTAQFADRQGRHAAANIAASLQDGELRPFRYRPLGQLCSIGGHRAVAEMLGVRIGGFFTWLIWRAVYLMKLPAWSRRLQTGFDWMWSAVFPRDLSHLKPSATERVARAHYRSGDYIIRRGEAPLAFYVIERGEVEVLVPTARGNESVVAVLGSGSFFGEQALVDDRPRAASVRARTPVDVVVMGRGVFTQISGTLAPLRDAFAKSIARRARDQWVERGDVAQVLARLALDRVLDPVPQPLLHPSTTLRDAARSFTGSTSEVLYVSTDGKSLAGLLTLTDLMRAQSHGAAPTTPIEGVMIDRPLVLTKSDDCMTVASTLQEHGYKSLPIVDDAVARRLVGCVRLRRLMEVVFATIPAPA